jgi:phage terminase large subunit GpA-like protein
MTPCTTEEQKQGILRALRDGLSPLRVATPIRLNEWMQEHFWMSEESSHGRARWKPWPFQVALADWMDDRNIEELNVVKSARVGYTKLLVAFVGYNAEHRKLNQAVWQPTDEDRDSFVKTEIEPMLRDVPIMQRVFPAFLAKSKENTLQLKKFLGSVLHTLGGKAAKNYRRITLAVAIIDELDAFDAIVEGSVNAFIAAWKRTEGALFRKAVAGTTPRVKGVSNIEQRASVAPARMRWHIDCPACGVEHPLFLDRETRGAKGGMRWDDRNEETVRHVCPHCSHEMTEREYRGIEHLGYYLSECKTYVYGLDRTWRLRATGEAIPSPRHVAALGVWTAMSPQVTWAQIVREYLNAVDAYKAGNKGLMMQFVNETLGELYEDDADQVKGSALARRAASEPRPYKQWHAPREVLATYASVDTQDDRWEIQFQGCGRNEGERWVIGYKVLYGNPALESEWDRLHEFVMGQIIQHESGAVLKPEGYGVDTGGHFFQQAKEHCAKYARHRVLALQGNPLAQATIKGRASKQDYNWRGKVVKNGVNLWKVGTNTAKDSIFARLTSVHAPGPGYIHFPLDLSQEYYEGLTCERRVPVKTSRGFITRWYNPPGSRNEPTDTFVYCEFMYEYFEFGKWNARMWDKREQALLPDLLGAKDAPMVMVDAEPDQSPAATQTARAIARPVRSRGRSNFVTSY